MADISNELLMRMNRRALFRQGVGYLKSAAEFYESSLDYYRLMEDIEELEDRFYEDD